MELKQAVMGIIFEAVDRVNQQVAPECWLEKAEDTILFGPSSPLDSLGFINFVAAVEAGCEERFGSLISLTEAGLGDTNSVQTLGQIADLLVRLLEKDGKARI